MDCNAVRFLLDFDRPWSPELEADDRKTLAAHLTSCDSCAELARVDLQADERLGAALRAVPVPEDLRGRILARLQAERGSWYRRGLLRAGAAAAAVAAVFFLVWLAWPRPRSVELPQDVAIIEQLFLSGRDREKVEEWFQNVHHVKIEAPRDFNYGLLAYCGMADFQGQTVPQLLFESGDKKALVYILSDKQFDLASLPAQPEAGSVYQVNVERPVDNAHVAYVVLYTGNSLDPFRRGRKESEVLGQDAVRAVHLASTPALRPFALPA